MLLRHETETGCVSGIDIIIFKIIGSSMIYQIGRDFLEICGAIISGYIGSMNPNSANDDYKCLKSKKTNW